MWLDILLFLFIVSILIGCKYSLPKKQFDDYLSIESTNALRGMLAIEIVLYHMAQKGVGGVFFTQLNHFGYLPVPIFFFLSGYGLMYQYKKKGRVYLKNIWISRIGYLSLIYFLVTILYSVFKYAIGREITWLGFFNNLILINPSPIGLWYLIVQIVLYMFFYFAFILDTKKTTKISLVFLFILLFSILLYFIKSEIFWYQSNFAFAVGLLWSEYKERIDGIIKKHFLASILLVSMVLFGSVSLLYFARYFNFNITFLDIILKNIIGIFATVFVVICMKVIKPNAKYWKFIGSISLEVYLIHPLVWVLLRNDHIYIQDDTLWTILTLAISICFAMIMNLFNKHILKFLRSLTNKMNY